MAKTAKFASCDTFVVLPSATASGQMIFGKNSDRPQGEVQEVVFEPARTFPDPSTVQQKCTYISVDSPSSSTYATILSKPAWMWGAEMGANEHGLAIGNEAVWTRLADPAVDAERRLLGMDLLRLALERAKTATEAVDVITSLLERAAPARRRQTPPELLYHNGFLIVDPAEAWVLETAGREWAAERVTSPFRNISNCLSIGSTIDRQSEGLQKTAIDRGLWDGSGAFHFAQVYGDQEKGDEERLKAGRALLAEATKDNQFSVKSMISVLRDKESGICRDCSDAFPTTSSQVSLLGGAGVKSVHWFTGTPDPQFSYFKPFIFHRAVKEASEKTKSPEVTEVVGDGSPDRRHTLYRRHEAFYERLRADGELQQTLRQIESLCIDELVEQAGKGVAEDDETMEMHCLFSDSVESELRFYK
ncbi:Secernin-2 [Tyrophagus putrescentiae]|nr:Secernin-2 [Tyrophagus putrescentiae]